jgi:Uma2 family endonuclease
MSTVEPRELLRIEYENAAQAYERSLPLEHYMEAISQSTQRKIALESLDLVHAVRPEIQVFSELLVQYPLDDDRIGQVVPDNMVLVHDEPIDAEGSYNVPFQPVRPFWVLEYVSKHTKRKDYQDNFHKYEKELKVPFCLLFYPEAQDLRVYRLSRGKYVLVKANAAGRYAIPDLEIEVALLDGWVRFWFRGELLPLPAQLQAELVETRRKLQLAEVQAHLAKEQVALGKEQLRLANEQARKAEEQARKAGEQARKAEEQARKAEERAKREREEKERLLARLRELGVEP